MFSDYTSLVGRAGTSYNSSNPTDATYARIDGGTSAPGYLTNIDDKGKIAITGKEFNALIKGVSSYAIQDSTITKFKKARIQRWDG